MSRLLFLVLLIIQYNSVTVQAEPVRAMWVVRYTLLDDQETSRLIQTAKRMNLTDIYVQVRALGKFFDQVEGNGSIPNNSVAYKNFQRILTDAHRQNIRVHAWLNAFFIHSRTDSVSNENHLAFSEQNYILRDAFSDTVPGTNDMKKIATEGLYLDPINQKNYNYLTNEIAYLIDTLKIDGIHLDYFRYPNASYVFSPSARTAFILNKYVDPVSIYQKDDSVEFTVRVAVEQDYQSFLRNNLSGFLAGIKKFIESRNQSTILSVAVKPDWEIAKNEYYQDWHSWLRNGTCDQVVLMNYSALDSIFYSNVLKAMRTEIASKVVVGVATYNLTTDPIVRRIEWLEKNHSMGFSLFSYNDIVGKPNLMKHLAKVMQN